MKNWQEYFLPRILERGWNYYKDGAVQSLTTTPTGYRATVSGTEDYEVEIELNGDEIAEMYCDCPYADDGNYCKHMAAVLYAVEEEDVEVFVSGNRGKSAQADKAKKSKNKKEDQIQEIVAAIPEEELRGIVISLARQDASFCNTLLTKYGPRDPMMLVRLEKEVDEIGWRHFDQSGFVDYEEAYDYACELQDVLYEHVPELIGRNCLKEAFELTNHVFHEIGTRDMDDSDGGTMEVAGACYEMWRRILDASDEREEEEMIRWFQEHRKWYVLDYLQDVMEEFMISEFGNEELLHEQLWDLDGQIRELEQSMDKDWYAGYQCEEAVLRRISIMERLGYSRQDIRTYRDQYRQFSGIRMQEVREYQQDRDYDKAAEVLRESKELDKDKCGLVSDYSQKLIDIYERTGDQVSYRKELLWNVFHCGQSGLECLLKLKSVCTEQEWNGYREKYLEQSGREPVKFMLLEHEKLYGRLLAEIEREGWISRLDQYEKVLKEHFPERVRDMYIRYVQSQAERTSYRKMYKELVVYLKKIKRYPDGEKMARKIADEWKQKYRRRSAMMDELGRAGF